MDIQELRFKVMCEMNLSHNRTTDETKSGESAIALAVSKQLDKNAYLNPDLSPKKEGCVVISQVLVSSLVGIIHYAHANGYIDSADHLRKIISSLEEGFIAQVPTKTSAPTTIQEWSSK